MTDMAQASSADSASGVAGEIRLTTRDGVTLDVSRASVEDVAELRDFFRRLPAEDLRFRFLETVKQVDEAVLRRMVEDGGDTTFLARAAKDRTLVAVASLISVGDHSKAEVAMSTLPDWKGKGVSWSLLEHVLAYAKDHGFTQVSSLESADNRQAIALEREMGFVAELNSSSLPEILASKTL